MEDINEKILKEGYGLKLLNGRKTRTGFVCRTNDGMKELKKAGSDENRLLFEYDAKEYLYKNGFCCLNRFLTTVSGSPYYRLDNMNYVLENYTEAQPMETFSQNDWIMGAGILAKLHIAGTGLQSEFGRSNIGKLPLLYEKRRTELMRIKKRISRQSCYSDVDLIVLKNFEYYSQRVIQAERAILASQYGLCVEKAKTEHTICHNAFKPENIRFTQKGELVVTGFGKCAYDCCAMDLAEYIRRYLKTEDCSTETSEKMLAAYHEVRNISKEDMDLIYGVLLYPYKFLKLCNEYYNKRRVCISGAMVERLLKCNISNGHTEKVLKQLKW